jgi:hypothetical protein
LGKPLPFLLLPSGAIAFQPPEVLLRFAEPLSGLATSNIAASGAAADGLHGSHFADMDTWFSSEGDIWALGCFLLQVSCAHAMYSVHKRRSRRQQQLQVETDRDWEYAAVQVS